MKLTMQTVRTLAAPAGKTDHIEWDEAMPGFGLRIRDGRKSYLVQYRLGQQQRRLTLGDVRRVSLEDARSNARQIFAKVALGTDPGAEKARARQTTRVAALTLGDVAVRYLDAKKDMLRPSSFKSAERHLTLHWAPLANRPLAEIKRAEIAARLQEIVKDYGRVAAARSRSTLSTLFGWSMREGLCEANPVIATNDPGRGLQSRDRVLSDTELAAVWRACRDDHFGRITKLLILTGCRRNEIGSLRWSEITGDVVTIAGTRVKNGRAHALTLPPLALQILASAPRRGDLVFGAGVRGYNSWAAATTALRLRIAEAEGAPLPPFTLHDFRRTFRSGLGRLGIPPHVAELAINHTRQGIQAVYDRHSYQHEIASALAMWAQHVAKILAGNDSSSNVTPLRRAQGGE